MQLLRLASIRTIRVTPFLTLEALSFVVTVADTLSTPGTPALLALPALPAALLLVIPLD